MTWWKFSKLAISNGLSCVVVQHGACRVLFNPAVPTAVIHFYDCHWNAWCVGLCGLNLQRLDCALDWMFLFSYRLLHLQTVSAPRSFQHLDLSIAPLSPPPLCTTTATVSQVMLDGPPALALGPAPLCAPKDKMNTMIIITMTTTIM